MTDTPTRSGRRPADPPDRRPPRARPPAEGATRGSQPRGSQARGAPPRGTKARRAPSDYPVVESAIDPKLVERRRQVRAEAHRTKVRRWIALGVVAALIAASIGALMSPLLDVDRVAVSGAKHLGAEDVIALSGVAHGDHLVSVDLAAVRSRLRADPWIASATVTRRLPGTIAVEIIEEEPLFKFTASDGTLLISHTGRVLSASPQGEALPVGATDTDLRSVDFDGSLSEAAPNHQAISLSALVGERLDGVVFDAAVLVGRLPEDLASQVRSIRIAGDNGVTLELADQAEVKFGQPDEIEAKLVATRAVLSQVVLDCIKSIDVREPTRAAVSRGPGCPGISPEVSDSEAQSSDSNDNSSESTEGSSTSPDTSEAGD